MSKLYFLTVWQNGCIDAMQLFDGEDNEELCKIKESFKILYGKVTFEFLEVGMYSPYQCIEFSLDQMARMI